MARATALHDDPLHTLLRALAQGEKGASSRVLACVWPDDTSLARRHRRLRRIGPAGQQGRQDHPVMVQRTASGSWTVLYVPWQEAVGAARRSVHCLSIRSIDSSILSTMPTSPVRIWIALQKHEETPHHKNLTLAGSETTRVELVACTAW